MDAAVILRGARRRAHASLREPARRAGTSHSALAAYETGRKQPLVGTLDRIVRSGGYEIAAELRPAVGGRELAEPSTSTSTSS